MLPRALHGRANEIANSQLRYSASSPHTACITSSLSIHLRSNYLSLQSLGLLIQLRVKNPSVSHVFSVIAFLVPFRVWTAFGGSVVYSRRVLDL